MPPVMSLQLVKPSLDVGVVAHDIEGMRSFYADVLAFERRPPVPVRDGEMVAHVVGTSALKLWCLDSPPDGDGGGIDSAIGYRMITLFLPDLDPVIARARAGGVRDIELSAWGDGADAVPLAFMPDADGNAIELVGLRGTEPSLHVGLTVRDIDRTRAFFFETLGLQAGATHTHRGTTSHSVQLGSTTIKFWHKGDDLPVRSGPITDHAGIRYVTAQVASVEQALRRLEARGAAVRIAPTKVGDVIVAFIADPDGNWIELIER